MDFWQPLVTRMPRNLDYGALYERFFWDLPASYNLGLDICDRHAKDKGKLALIHNRGDGTAEKWTFFELKRASDRFANALSGLGIERGDRVAVKRPDPVMMLGYWNNKEATQEAFIGDWLKTGDLAAVDEEGYFRFTGRDDDFIISAGYRIGPAEIEDALTRHEEVLMAAVVARPDEERGQ